MSVVRSLDEVEPAASVVTIGVFDGVHRGHREIISRAVDLARDAGLRSVVVTFDRHPEEVVRPDAVPGYLQPLEAKVACLSELDVDLVLVLAFTQALSKLEPEAFVTEVLAGPLAAERVVVGENFRYGHHATGDIHTLRESGERHGFDVDAVGLVGGDGDTVSSTAIRERLRAGDVAWAAEAIGRPHRVRGTVIRGEGRGRSIGIPTANVAVLPGLVLPALGVYAGRARMLPDGPWHPAVVNIGSRPTFGGRDVTVEAHLLETDEGGGEPDEVPTTPDLYGKELEVGFVARLRDEQRFSGPDELVEQIHRDIEKACEILLTR